MMTKEDYCVCSFLLYGPPSSLFPSLILPHPPLLLPIDDLNDLTLRKLVVPAGDIAFEMGRQRRRGRRV